METAGARRHLTAAEWASPGRRRRPWGNLEERAPIDRGADSDFTTTIRPIEGAAGVVVDGRLPGEDRPPE
ncbi:hypothetical protein QN239_08005 [Mycolicibacterium sp. Y3]